MINLEGIVYYCYPSKKDSQPEMYSQLAKEGGVIKQILLI